MPKLILPRNPNSIANLNPKTLIFTPKLRTLSSSSSSSSQLQSKPKSHPETNLSSPTNDQITQLILEQKSPIELFKTFKWASNLPNFTHNQSSYRAMIHKLCIFRRFDNAHQLLDEMPDSIGCPPDEGVFVTLVRGLGRGKRVREVIRVPELMRKFGVECSLKVFNSILNVLVAENIDVAREFFRKKIIEAGFVGDDYTYGIMMKGFSLTNRIDDGYKLLELMKSRGLNPNVVIYNTMMHSLCKHGKVEKARKLMDEIVEPSDVTYNLMISAYCKEGIAIEAQVLLEKSIASGFVPDVVSTTKVVDLLCNLGRVVEAGDVLERVESVGGVIDDVAYNTLIKGFCSIRKPKVGLLFKKQMENKRYLPNTETYNILIGGFFDIDLLDMAADLFNEMKRAAINRNFVTYDTMIKGFCSKGRVEDAFEILEEMEESKGGSGGRISPYNSIIYGLYREKRGDEALDFLNKLSKMFPRMVDRTLNMLALCKDGNLETAKAVYEMMLHEGGFPSVLVYNSLIQGFAKYKHFNEAFRLMNEMVDRGFFPVALTYNAVISGFCEFGKIESALHFTGDLKEKGLPLDVGSYSPFIFAICDKGDLQEAFEIFQLLVDKGIRPDYSIWTSMVHCLNRETNWLEPDNLALLNNRIQVILET